MMEQSVVRLERSIAESLRGVAVMALGEGLGVDRDRCPRIPSAISAFTGSGVKASLLARRVLQLSVLLSIRGSGFKSLAMHPF